MKRTPMKRTAPLRRTNASGPSWEREEKPWAAALVSSTLKPLARGSYGGSTSGEAVAKDEPYRDPVLLEMSRGRPCLLLVPGVCSHRTDTVVAAHSNLAEHGKGGARKADDCYTCWADGACHAWLDQGPAPKRLKRSTFMGAHALQVLAWSQIATDPNEPERFRQAARRALERLGATPLGDTPCP